MDEIERYIFDTQGCLVLPEVLSQDEVGRLVAAIPRDAAGSIIGAENRTTFRGLLDHPEPLFRQLIDHPRILPYLRALLLGPSGDPGADRIFLSHEYGLVFRSGDSGPCFHNGGTPHRPWLAYHASDDRIFCGLLTVHWVLSDTADGDGGFWYIPGSHKAAFPLPRDIQSYERVPSCTVQPAMRAGSALIFTEALTHGTRPWKAAHERIALFYKYQPGHMTLSARAPVNAPLTDDQRRFITFPQERPT
jgi:ectoine hydroxylase-related dioxygenase (phytanoyl-CoA dioxygenase family)